MKSPIELDKWTPQTWKCGACDFFMNKRLIFILVFAHDASTPPMVMED